MEVWFACSWVWGGYDFVSGLHLTTLSITFDSEALEFVCLVDCLVGWLGVYIPIPQGSSEGYVTQDY